MKPKDKSTKKTIMISAFALLFVGILVGGAFAFPFWMPRMNADNSTSTALKTGDYQGYLNAIEANWQRYKATITQDVFNQMSQRYINNSARIEARQASMQAVDKAIQDNSYSEWTTAINALTKKPAFTSLITADNFLTYVKLYNAEKSGNWTDVKTYAQELGIVRGMHFRGRKMMGEISP